MSETNTQQALPVEYIVEKTAFDAAVHVLGQLPYSQVAATMQLLEQRTRAREPERPHVRELHGADEKLADFGDVVAEVILELDLMVTREGFIWSSESVVRTIADKLCRAYTAATGVDVRPSVVCIHGVSLGETCTECTDINAHIAVATKE